MVVQVTLHTVLQFQAPGERVIHRVLTLHEGATVGSVIQALGITYPVKELLLVVNRMVCQLDTVLKDGDHVDLIPAMSGGAEPPVRNLTLFS